MKVSIRRDGSSKFVAEVRSESDENDVLYISDPDSDAAIALRGGETWARWFEGLGEGRFESIYYILAIPETWPGPPPGSHPYSGLHFKIGRAKDVRKRVQNLRTGTSSRLIVHALEPGSSALESMRHKQFEVERRQGEWFACSPILVGHVFAIWKRHRAMFPEDRAEISHLMDRIDILGGVRSLLGGAPDMINPSLNEAWVGKVFVDLVYANPLWKKGAS